MRIGICDDNLEEAKLIEEVCKATYDAECIEYELIMFDGAEEVLAFNEDIHLLILDIEMPGISGLELKEKLQSGYREASIIYVTSHDELMPEAFGLHVYGFVEKENVRMKLPIYLNKYISRIDPYVILEDYINSRDVKYIKAADVYVELYLKSGEYVVARSTMKEYEKLLKECPFVKISRSYMINLAYVTKLDEGIVHIKEEKFKISRRRMEDVEEKYEAYCWRKARYCG